MEKVSPYVSEHRRTILRGVFAGSLASALPAAVRAAPAPAPTLIDLPFAGGQRELTNAFPQKHAVLLQRTRPPLLETPFAVFDHDVITPNDRFYVRWHLANIPNQVDGAAFRISVHGLVDHELALSLDELVTKFQPVRLTAVNQCSGNSRGFFSPRVPGGQWANGAMGNAVWTGVRLRDVLERAGVKAGAVAVRFHGLDSGVIPTTPTFMKSLQIDHARDGEVMIAYAMNGKPLPVLNGFPVRLIVPGWYSTYWVKMLSDIEVLGQPDDNYWMAKAYLVPDNPAGNVEPCQSGIRLVPISRMLPRSFITNLVDGQHVRAAAPLTVRGIAFGGDTGVRAVAVSPDGGSTWSGARLGPDHGKYSFRQWELRLTPKPGPMTLKVKATNTDGLAQPGVANWNPGGYMRNVIESMTVHAT
jgi:DMSO/TMAO reductase YedYZ molybdopterin-dependent catalytic subunit